jgi:RNA polymerase sigma-70 factor (ECF subfamily)
MGEAELAAGFVAGEPGSVAEMYRDYGRLVYVLTNRVLGDAGLAEEATRQTFVRAWRLAADLDPGHNLEPWLEGIAVRTARDIHHHNRAHANPQAAADPGEPISTDPTAQPGQGDGVWPVRRALDRLPADDREFLRLQHDRRLTHREISDLLAIPLDRVKTRSHQAHRRLAELLGHVPVDREARTPRATDGGPEQANEGAVHNRPPGLAGPNIVT